LGDSEDDIVIRALGELREAGPRGAGAVPAIVREFDRAEFNTKDNMIDALTAIGPSAKAAVPMLVETMKKVDNSRLAPAAAAALLIIDSGGRYREAALTRLKVGIQAPESEESRTESLKCVLAIQVMPRELAPVLIAGLLGDPNSTNRRLCAMALARVADRQQECAVALEQALKDPDQFVRVQAVEGISVLCPPAKVAKQSLLIALSDRSVYVRRAATESSEHLCPDATLRVPDLARHLADPSASVRRLAALALGRIGPPAITAKSNLERMLGDIDKQAAAAAAKSLQKITGQ
jgi:hypothetical protein